MEDIGQCMNNILLPSILTHNMILLYVFQPFKSVMIDKTFMSSMHKRNIKLISFGKKNYYSHNIKSNNIIFNMIKVLRVTFKYQSVCIFLNTYTKISFGKTFLYIKSLKFQLMIMISSILNYIVIIMVYNSINAHRYQFFYTLSYW